ncbi:hypothetical protein ACNQGB_04760 [Flavobacterium sp. XS1P32]|uniref:hypothetical protein n=1 Tax=Flavobacterium sp. XS1P32 TaxID=3401726 RepID=UPI003AACCCE2
MNLYYVHLGLDYETYINTNNELRFEFQKQTEFIDDYFSKAIRKYKFKTDGTFNMIAISLTEFTIKPSSLVPSKVLDVELPFDKSRYDRIKGTKDCGYYIELLEQGFTKASEFKSIPLESLLNIIEEFKRDGYKNEWLHKKKKFKEQDLEIKLTCEFNAICFQVIATINQISTKKELTKGVIIRTETGVSIHQGTYKDILIDDLNVIITDSSNEPRILINIEDVLNNRFNYKFAEYISSDDYSDEENKYFKETREEVNKLLSYNGK